jgi:Tol biopolymer transport system component
MDRNGATHADNEVSRPLITPRLSPDDKFLAFVALGPTSGSQNIWILDRARRTTSRLTFGALDSAPVWSPDGKWIAYSAADVLPNKKVVIKATDGSGAERDILRGDDIAASPTSWSPDGRNLLVRRLPGGAANPEIWIVSLTDGTARPLLRGRRHDQATISPDGRWLAYTADENGTPQWYLTHFPELRGKWQAFSSEARFARWSRDGKQLYYSAGDDMLTAVGVDLSGEAPRFSNPEAVSRISAGVPGIPYDVTNDGKFLLAVPAFDESSLPLTLITNWKAKLGLR